MRQLALGILSVAIGLGLILLAVSPVLLGAMQHPPVHGDPLLLLFWPGLFLFGFGFWLIPSSGAGPAAQNMITVFGPIIDRVPGMARKGDPKPEDPSHG